MSTNIFFRGCYWGLSLLLFLAVPTGVLGQAIKNATNSNQKNKTQSKAPNVYKPTNKTKEWNGSIRMEETFSGSGVTTTTTINVSIINSKAHGSIESQHEMYMAGKLMCKSKCSGAGVAQLHDVIIDMGDSTYRIEVISPENICWNEGPYCETPRSTGFVDIITTQRRFYGVPNVFTGTEVRSGTIPGDLGTATTKMSWHLYNSCPPWKEDPYTVRRIEDLDGRVKEATSKFVRRVYDELCIKLRVAQGKRTVSEQNKLYAQGRTTPGLIVTNSRGGSSYHNYGMAVDVYIIKDDGTIDLDIILPPEVVDIAEQEGFSWGGYWRRFKDYPHFEMSFGQSIDLLKRMHGIR